MQLRIRTSFARGFVWLCQQSFPGALTTPEKVTEGASTTTRTTKSSLFSHKMMAALNAPMMGIDSQDCVVPDFSFNQDMDADVLSSLSSTFCPDMDPMDMNSLDMCDPFPFTEDALTRHDAVDQFFGTGFDANVNQTNVLGPLAPPTLRRQPTKERFDELLQRALSAGDGVDGADHRTPTAYPPSVTTATLPFSAPTSQPGPAGSLLMANPLAEPLSRGNSRDVLIVPQHSHRGSSVDDWSSSSRGGSPASSTYSSRSPTSRGHSPSESPVSDMEHGSLTIRRRLKGASTNPRHAAGRNHVCQQCSSRFLCKSKLDRHMLTHTGAKPFGCFCGKRFNQKSALKNHTRRHLRKQDIPHTQTMERQGLNGFSLRELEQ